MLDASIPINIFISHAASDDVHRDALRKHLSVLKRQGLVNTWHVGHIAAGDEKDSVIQSRLDVANIVILLISAEYFASDSQWLEMERALAHHVNQRVRVFSVVLDACDWQAAPVVNAEVLPRNRVPVRSWSNQSEAWASVVQAIRASIDGDLFAATAMMTSREIIWPLVPNNPPHKAVAVLPASPERQSLNSASHRVVIVPAHPPDFQRCDVAPHPRKTEWWCVRWFRRVRRPVLQLAVLLVCAIVVGFIYYLLIVLMAPGSNESRASANVSVFDVVDYWPDCTSLGEGSPSGSSRVLNVPCGDSFCVGIKDLPDACDQRGAVLLDCKAATGAIDKADAKEFARLANVMVSRECSTGSGPKELWTQIRFDERGIVRSVITSDKDHRDVGLEICVDRVLMRAGVNWFFGDRGPGYMRVVLCVD